MLMKIMLLSVIVANSAFIIAITLLSALRLDVDARLFWRLEIMSHDQALATPSQLHDLATLVRASARDASLRLVANREVQRSELLIRMNAKHLTLPDYTWDTVPFGLLHRWNRETGPLANPYLLHLETKYHTARLICLKKFGLREGNWEAFGVSSLAALASFFMVHLIHGIRMQRMNARKSMYTAGRCVR